jgi:hypothetical protein
MSSPAAAQVAALPAVLPAPVSLQLRGDPIALVREILAGAPHSYISMPAM